LSESEYGAQTRTAIVVRLLYERPRTAKDLAEATGLTVRSIYYVLDNISLGEVPITNDDNGIWYMLTSEEQKEMYHLIGTLESELATAHKGQAFTHGFKVKDIASLVAITKRFACAPEPD
jgi:transcriptional antiterminator